MRALRGSCSSGRAPTSISSINAGTPEKLVAARMSSSPGRKEGRLEVMVVSGSFGRSVRSRFGADTAGSVKSGTRPGYG
jgi:hypothetical protein